MQWQQQLELLKANLLALGMRRLIALGAVAAVTMAAVGLVGYYSSRSENEALYVGLSAADVSRMGAALQVAGIPFDVSPDGTKILVRRVQAPSARMLLAEKGLPSGATAGYELFDKLGPLGLTSFMQEVTRVRALEGELARTIQTMKGIKTARVHIVYPDGNAFRRSRQPASASVVVGMEGLREAAHAHVIRHLVAAAVPGLAADHVSVMSTDGTVLAAGGDAGGAASAKLIELERAVASRMQESIRRTLAPYLGLENFEISVTARLNLDKRQLNEQIYDPESKIERSTRVIKEAGTQQNTGQRSTVTVEQNVPTEPGAQAGGEQSRRSNERREELTNFELSSRTIATSSEGHRIEALSVAVVLNRKRLVTGGGTEDAQGLERKIKEIETLVTTAAGINASRGDKITVAAVDFIDPPPETASRLGVVDSILMQLDRFIIAVTVLAAVAIFIWLGLLPAVRTITAQPAQEAAPAALADQTAQSTDARTIEGRGSDGRAIDGQAVPAMLSAGEQAVAKPLALIANTPQAKLAELIERDDKQVAEILKQWMAKA